MNAVNREPAIKRRHPADDIPDKPAGPQSEPKAQTTNKKSAPVSVPAPAVPLDERLIEQHNVRIRPSTKARLKRAVDKLRYETGDRTISEASLTDRALLEFLERNNC
ncbi:hypothetical protein B7C42_07684 [Nocardia cerradoensis]|uniref:Uncharacterized protein n=1 Tax=Nocardia cerradoensis TaxID=85688 RepID=A0A231GUF4_9NOCA|nr:hypothetical protein [Nocardia cerradoensis]OXR40259.1 hypothetical protein B7C42_07684 [Nocardia cerradoensis]